MRTHSRWTISLAALALLAGTTALHSEDKKDDAKTEGKTKEVKARDLTLIVPDAWETKEGTQFRAAQMTIRPSTRTRTRGAANTSCSTSRTAAATRPRT